MRVQRASLCGLAIVALATGAGCFHDVSQFRNGDGGTDAQSEAGGDVADAGVADALDAADAPTIIDVTDVADVGVDAFDAAEVSIDAPFDAPPEVALPEAGPEPTRESGAPDVVDVVDVVDVLDVVSCDAAVDDVEVVDGGCVPNRTRDCYPAPSETRNVGTCRPGLEWCLPNGTWSGVCHGAVVPAVTDTCGNEQDDDCDGDDDDDGCFPPTATMCRPREGACYSGPVATRGRGECMAGTYTCAAIPVQIWERCNSTGPNLVDRCGDGLDDDCNGVVDDGCQGWAPTAYTMSTSESIPFIDVCRSDPHHEVMESDDDDVSLIPRPTDTNTLIPFALRYYGRAMPPILLVSSNGWLSFGEDGSQVYYAKKSSLEHNALGEPMRPNNIIAPFWMDLRLTGNGVCFGARGTAPNRKYVIQWDDVDDFSRSTISLDAEVIINEAPPGQNNVIEFVYRNVSQSRPASFTAGLEDANGEALPFTGPIVSGTSVRFTPTPIPASCR